MTERSIVPRLDAIGWAWIAVLGLAYASAVAVPLSMVLR